MLMSYGGTKPRAHCFQGAQSQSQSKVLLRRNNSLIDDFWKSRGTHSVSACGCSAGGTVKPRERLPDTGKRSGKGIRNASQALSVGYMQL